MSGFGKDLWHKEVRTLADLYKVSPRRWGIVVTVTDDPTLANNTDWHLTKGLADNNRNNNANWEPLEVYLNVNTGATDKKYQEFTGTGPTFTVNNGTIDLLDFVEVNGVIQREGTDFVLTGQTVDFTNSLPANSTTVVHYFESASISTRVKAVEAGQGIEVDNSNPLRPVVAQKNSSRTIIGNDVLQQTDDFYTVYFNSAADITFLIPQLLANTVVGFINIGTGKVEFLADTGVTISGIGYLKGGVNATAVVNFRTATNPVIVAGADKLVTPNPQPGNYQFQIEDADGIVLMQSGSANNCEVPNDSTTDFDIGTQLAVAQMGAGQTTVTAEGGVTIRCEITPPYRVRSQYAGAVLLKIGVNEWLLNGALTNS